jgi:hypothetical protein
MRLDIRDIVCTAEVLSLDDVWFACLHPRAAAWDDDAERGRRLLVRGVTQGGRVIRVILYPVEDIPGT